MRHIFFFERNVFINTLFLFYTLFCVCFYDPIVSVDDTPRTPLFREVVSSAPGVMLLSSRNKDLEPKLKFDTIKKIFGDSQLALPKVIFTLFLIGKNSLSKYFYLIRNSVNIRAPSDLIS